MRVQFAAAILVAVIGISGCSKSDSDLPPLHPVKGVITTKGASLDKGSLMVRPETDNPNVVVVANLTPDGNFDLSTILVKDRSSKKHPGAPAGTYKLSYAVASDEQIPPIELKNPFVVEAGQNNQWTVDLADKK